MRENESMEELQCTILRFLVIFIRVSLYPKQRRSTASENFITPMIDFLIERAPSHETAPNKRGAQQYLAPSPADLRSEACNVEGRIRLLVLFGFAVMGGLNMKIIQRMS